MHRSQVSRNGYTHATNTQQPTEFCLHSRNLHDTPYQRRHSLSPRATGLVQILLAFDAYFRGLGQVLSHPRSQSVSSLSSWRAGAIALAISLSSALGTMPSSVDSL